MNYLDSSSWYELRIDPEYWLFQNWYNARVSALAIRMTFPYRELYIVRY